ncbi:tetratricopeptide repeat protein [Myxococcota bacterium]|nr:tetratricopeptide repeat protein [Myxococcota bacterium]
MIAALSIVFAGGCATTTVVEGGQPEVASRGRAKRDLGIDYLSTGRTAMAIRELTASLEHDPSDPVTHLWIGDAYRRKAQSERARLAFETAARLAEKNRDTQTLQDARLNLSALLSQMGRPAEAIPHCEALAVDPTYPSPWRPLTNCAWAMFQLGRYDDARARLQTALEYFPRFGPALLNLGILESKLGHSLAAATAFEKAIESGRLDGSGRTEAHFRLGEIFVALGNREKAIAHFRAAVETGPTLEWGSQSQAYLDLLH